MVYYKRRGAGNPVVYGGCVPPLYTQGYVLVTRCLPRLLI